MEFQGLEIVCPRCKDELQWRTPDKELECRQCLAAYPVLLGIPDLRVFPDPYIGFDEDRAKAQRVYAEFDARTFPELIDFYYSITPVVPPHHAQQYKRGLMAGEAKARMALASWEAAAGGKEPSSDSRLLELGCGTSPLLVAAAETFGQVVGIDISFRWLTIGKKRLAEAGLDVPLICACAEALPFPDGTFSHVAAESVLENVKEQGQVLTEAQRVLKPGGELYVATPNKFSLGPDPHTGIWAGGYLPDGWTANIVKRQGGIPPKRKLLTAGSLAKLLRAAGFAPPTIYLPPISAEQRRLFGPLLRGMIDGYQLARSMPGSKQLLRLIGPLLHAVSHKAS